MAQTNPTDTAATALAVTTHTAGSRPKRLTYAASKALIYERLRGAGWSLDTGRVFPRALHPYGRFALYFKPQAVWVAATNRGEPRLQDATSTWDDVREWAAMGAGSMVEHLDAMAGRVLS